MVLMSSSVGLQQVAPVAFEFVKDMLNVTIPGTIQIKPMGSKTCVT